MKYIFLILLLYSCQNKGSLKAQIQTQGRTIVCNDTSCYGTYVGPEFVNGSDIAHQFSNKMSKRVGDQLKELYSKGQYSKVSMNAIQMTTKGMGSGTVSYDLLIPFVRVSTSCEAFTSFDHVGGWNHSPALEARKKQLKSLLLPGEALYISNLKKTKEGLEEYWIQWRNKEVQSRCK